jgi:hypothetical protein
MAAFESIPPPSNLTAVSAERPQLSQMGGMMGGGPPGAAGGGVSRAIFEVKKQVRSLAMAIPAAAKEIASIDQLLDAVMMKAIPSGGGADALSSGGPMGSAAEQPGF